MADEIKNYENIDIPYNTYLSRGEITTPEGSLDSSNGTKEEEIKSGDSLNDIWIRNFIKSENYSPKKKGFMINGLTGYAEFMDVSISGNITALTGAIGGFTIGSDYIRDVANSMGLSSVVSGADDVRFWAGDTFANKQTAPFRVTEAGILVASSATITGTVTATAGSIGGWTIDLTTITAGGITLDSAGFITGSTIRTATSGARAQLTGGNDIELYDDTTGGGGSITGNVAEINMIRTDDATKYFTLRKRAGKDNDSDNILELFPSTQASSRFNAMFLGRDGIGNNNNIGSTTITINKDSTLSYGALNGNFTIEVALNGTLATHGSFLVQDARIIYANATKSGVCVVCAGSGTDGISGLGWFNGTATGVGFWQDSTKLNIGLSMLPDTNNAYDIGSAIFKINNVYTTNILIYGDFSVAFVNSDFLPKTANTYNLGSSSFTWKNLNLAGTAVISGKLQIPVGTNLY